MNLKEQIAEVLAYSQNLDKVNVDRIYDQWRESKKYFIDLFGGLTYESPKKILFQMNDKDKQKKFNEFIGETIDVFYDKTEFIPFINFLESIPANDFYNNMLSHTYTDENISIPIGTKVLKSFKYFLKNKELLSEIQNRASMVIQKNKVEGYLCLSVHPLDFLSSSENTYNWRSCHSLDGDFRQGNLSYMLDSSTFICYLKSEKDVKLPNFPESVPWNNKKWRCLFFMDNHHSCIFAGRQYPFFAPTALDSVRDLLLELLPKKLSFYSERSWSHWHDDCLEQYDYKEHEEDSCYLNGSKYVIIRGRIYNLEEIISDAENSAHFNDLLNSSYYTHPFYMWEKNAWDYNYDIHFDIGSMTPCIHCGEDVEILTEGSMMCIDCECDYGTGCNDNFYYCDRCGSRFPSAYVLYIDGDIICPSCQETDAFSCARCGELYYKEDRVYDEEYQTFICKHCANILKEKRNG